jgi:hypothetical protein
VDCLSACSFDFSRAGLKVPILALADPGCDEAGEQQNQNCRHRTAMPV